MAPYAWLPSSTTGEGGGATGSAGRNLQKPSFPPHPAVAWRLDTRAGSRVPSWPVHLPGTPDGGGRMGSVSDRAPDLTRSSTGSWPPLPTRPRLQPIASIESRGATLPWQEPPGSGGAAPAPSLRCRLTPPSVLSGFRRRPPWTGSETQLHERPVPAGISWPRTYPDPTPDTRLLPDSDTIPGRRESKCCSLRHVAWRGEQVRQRPLLERGRVDYQGGGTPNSAVQRTEGSRCSPFGR